MLLAPPAFCQLTPMQAGQIQSTVGDRVEALAILGGDYGLAGGTFRSTGKFTSGVSDDAILGVTKLGGAGDIGDPVPIAGLGVGWQWRVQGNIGLLQSSNHLHSALLEGDINQFNTYAVEFGGGVRVWFTDHFSLAPTLAGLYGHTTDSYHAGSAFMRANLGRAAQAGLVDWNVDTFSLRSAVNLQYVFNLSRTVITVSADGTYFRTRMLQASSAAVRVEGDSGSVANTIDVDVPTDVMLVGHELHVGGYLSRTQLFGDLQTGLDVAHLYEIHGRVVLNFLNELWKVNWLGLGASYVRGPGMTGWTFGADVTFRF